MILRKTTICKSCGKDKPHVAHGLCGACYTRERRLTHPPDRRSTIATCKICGESRLHMGRGMCVKCYQRWYRGSMDSQGVSTPNESCSTYLGVNIAENIIRKIFKNVETVPYGNKGYDFICNRGLKIDVKSACRHKSEHKWSFGISHNKIADYFICMAFDNREDLNPLYIWLIPGKIVNHLSSPSISESNLSKWDKYKLDINKVTACCDTMKQSNQKKVA